MLKATELKNTRMCKYALQHRTCPQRGRCSFAHTTKELREKPHPAASALDPAKYKTLPCRNPIYLRTGAFCLASFVLHVRSAHVCMGSVFSQSSTACACRKMPVCRRSRRRRPVSVFSRSRLSSNVQPNKQQRSFKHSFEPSRRTRAPWFNFKYEYEYEYEFKFLFLFKACVSCSS